MCIILINLVIIVEYGWTVHIFPHNGIISSGGTMPADQYYMLLSASMAEERTHTHSQIVALHNLKDH